MPFLQSYLGDAVYIELTEANDIRLYTSNGVADLDEIFLEPSVERKLQEWLEQLPAARASLASEGKL